VSIRTPHLRLLAPARDDAPGRAPPREWDGMAAALLVVGLVPHAGLALLGSWPRWELGAGTAMALFALRQLLHPA
jgi:hypothetical protein